MIRIFLTLLAAAPLLLFGPRADAEDAPLTKSDVEAIMRDYLLANPEILEEAFTALQAKRQAEAEAARKGSLSQYRDALENTPGDPVLGNPAGDVTMVEFFDYNCGYCRRAHEDLERLIAADPQLKVIMKEFPVLGQGSMEAAAVSILVNDLVPESYPEFHERLITADGQANEKVALSIATDMGLPVDEIRAKLRSDKVRETVQSSYEIAQALGLSGTPSYVVGDTVEFGAVGYDTLRTRINEARCGEMEC
ncbi:DsbA family protein [Acuticoccus mangrovi]|uniref:DsbA family protein n=1 Tax=Acuticoccus mangrovi TaxID=2796142 RepID=A0A934IDY5_9HYPH|nr:DsbA family protein [Acuticoccus mangrovi]MBJ3774799.1 DsbA family protein [Acuticoccus mangrovi]